MRRSILPAIAMVALLLCPMVGSLSSPPDYSPIHNTGNQFIQSGWSSQIPIQEEPDWVELPWWKRTSLDSNHDGIHDSLENRNGIVWVGLSFGRSVTSNDLNSIRSMGLEPQLEIPAVDEPEAPELPACFHRYGCIFPPLLLICHLDCPSTGKSGKSFFLPD